MSKRNDRVVVALSTGDVDQVSRMLSSGADVNSTDQGGRTALHYVAADGRVELGILLIAAGADVNARDKKGWTPLHAAAREYRVDIARLLLDHGAFVDPQDTYGNTPLSKAVYYSGERGDMIGLLLSYKADRHLKNYYSVSPLSLAETIAGVDVKQFFDEESEQSVEASTRRTSKSQAPGGGQIVANARKSERPLVEHPGGGFGTALDAIRGAMGKLDRMDAGGRWVVFSGQGQGHNEGTFQIEDVPFLGRTFDLKGEKVDLTEMARFAELDEIRIGMDVAPDGKVTLQDATLEQLARFLDAIFRKHFRIQPFEGENDYAVSVEWM